MCLIDCRRLRQSVKCSSFLSYDSYNSREVHFCSLFHFYSNSTTNENKNQNKQMLTTKLTGFIVFSANVQNRSHCING